MNDYERRMMEMIEAFAFVSEMEAAREKAEIGDPLPDSFRDMVNNAREVATSWINGKWEIDDE